MFAVIDTDGTNAGDPGGLGDLCHMGSPLTTAGLPEATQKHLSILKLAYSRLATSNVGRREKVCVFMRLVGVPWEGLGMESEYSICYSTSRSPAAFPFSSEAACPILLL